MRILCVHAHFDDYEFFASGTFELWKRQLGDKLRARALICTDGKAGHHFRTREELHSIRMREQEASARIGGYELEVLRLPDGQVPREACLQVSTPLLAALWKSIRAFEPDYLFCPPIPSDPLVGVHVDHLAVAEAVRKVAYMINVPHAFTPEYPADERRSAPCQVPVILNAYDGYMSGGNAFDLAIDVEGVFPKVCEMTYCHQSQLKEWLPWVGRHQMEAPATLEDWAKTLRARFERENRDVGIHAAHIYQVFTVTAWGQVPTLEQLLADFPGVCERLSNLAQLRQRLARWSH
jgi:LmbE family N-acetylglucosaminyl deacetylase